MGLSTQQSRKAWKPQNKKLEGNTIWWKISHLNNMIDWIPTHSLLSQSMLSVPAPSLRTSYEIPTPTSASEVALCLYFTDRLSGMLSFAKRLSGVNMHQHHYRLDFLETLQVYKYHLIFLPLYHKINKTDWNLLDRYFIAPIYHSSFIHKHTRIYYS